MLKSVRLKLFVCSLFAAVSLFGQAENGEILGTIHDPAGGTIPRASITLLNQGTGIEAKTATDEEGNYNFLNVRTGLYTVTAEAPGFSKVSTKDVQLVVNARQRVDLTMQVGEVTQSVEVADAAAVLETDTSEHGQVIGQQAIVELPTNGRNYSDLALLSTNIHRSVLNTALTNPPREGAFNANGMRSTYNNFLLDGMDNNAYSTSNQGFSNQVAQPSPDAVQEFKVITSNYSAEYGRVGGAVVNVVMRSGTNQIHGSAYDFLRNTELNAFGYFPAALKPPLQRNQFGTAFGGPIVKNKIFFFGDYEGFRNIQKVLFTDSIPSASDRAFVVPSTLTQGVYDPRSGATYAAGSTIPLSVVTPFAQKVLGDLPPTTAAGRSGNFRNLAPIRDYADKYDVKLDAHFTDRMSTFLRWDQRKDNNFFGPDITGPSGGGQNGYVRSLDQAAAFGYTWVVTPTSVFEARLGYTRIRAGKQPPFLGGPSLQDIYGVTGAPTASYLTGGLNTQTIGGFSSLGRQATNPQFQNPSTWQPKFTYSKNLRRHSLKAGFEMGIIHTQVMDINPPYGLNQYQNSFSRPASCIATPSLGGCSDTTSYNLTDFYFGLPSQVSLSTYLVGNYRQRQYFGYLQDDYRVNNRLTLNIGLRYEFATPRWERDNVLSNYDPSTNTIIKAQDGDLSQRTLVNPDRKDWGPRVGLAYSIDPKTVFRGGYGISYTYLNRLGSADELGINFPQVVIAVVNQSLPAGTVGLPAGFITAPNFPNGIIDPAKVGQINTHVAYIPKDTRWPMIQTWFFSIQREILKDTVVELGYSGNKGTHLPILADYNQAFPNLPGQSLGVQQRRPNQAFGGITWVDPAGNTSYNGLSLRVERRYSGGLYLLNSFTWSKAMGDTEQALENVGTNNNVANPQNIRNLALEHGPSSYDQKLVNVTSVVYELPFGKGRKFGAHWNPVVDAALGGWQVSAINTLATGLPINIQYTPTAAFDATGRTNDFWGLAVQRPNLVGDPRSGAGNDVTGTPYWFNKAAFAIPTDPSQPFGNLSRNAVRGPGFWQPDFAVNKTFRIPVREGMGLQFRSEFFNIFNHTNFGFPDPNISSATFGRITTTLPARQIQFALKLNF
jgi:hypothetical protein